MVTIYSLLCFVAVIAVMTVLMWREDTKRREERAGLGFSDFAASEALEGVSPRVLRVIYDEFYDWIDCSPLAEDQIVDDYGIDGSDIDDVLQRCSEQLGITWTGRGPIVVYFRSVADLAQLLESKLAQASDSSGLGGSGLNGSGLGARP